MGSRLNATLQTSSTMTTRDFTTDHSPDDSSADDQPWCEQWQWARAEQAHRITRMAHTLTMHTTLCSIARYGIQLERHHLVASEVV